MSVWYHAEENEIAVFWGHNSYGYLSTFEMRTGSFFADKKDIVESGWKYIGGYQ